MNPKQQKSGYINQVSSKHEAPEPCMTMPKPTPDEALKLGIKLPWDGKVQQMRPDDLNKQLFIDLESYGVTRLEMMKMFHLYNDPFQALLKQWGIPKGMTGGANRAARAGNLEKAPAAPIIHTRPGQTLTSRKAELARNTEANAGKLLDEIVVDEPVKIMTEEEMDAELARVETELAVMVGNIADGTIETSHVATPAEVQEFFAPDEDENGLNFQDRHFLGICEGPIENISGISFTVEGLTEQGRKNIDAMAIDAEMQQLETCLLQGASELGTFPAAGLQIGLLVGSKQQQYGDTISSMGPLLRVLYPDGIGHNQYDDLALIVRILDKIGRITKGNGQGSEDAWGDLAGYALLGQAGLQRKSA